jgi:hypothetical protein
MKDKATHSLLAVTEKTKLANNKSFKILINDINIFCFEYIQNRNNSHIKESEKLSQIIDDTFDTLGIRKEILKKDYQVLSAALTGKAPTKGSVTKEEATKLTKAFFAQNLGLSSAFESDTDSLQKYLAGLSSDQTSFLRHKATVKDLFVNFLLKELKQIDKKRNAQADFVGKVVGCAVLVVATSFMWPIMIIAPNLFGMAIMAGSYISSKKISNAIKKCFNKSLAKELGDDLKIKIKAYNNFEKQIAKPKLSIIRKGIKIVKKAFSLSK